MRVLTFLLLTAIALQNSYGDCYINTTTTCEEQTQSVGCDMNDCVLIDSKWKCPMNAIDESVVRPNVQYGYVVSNYYGSEDFTTGAVVCVDYYKCDTGTVCPSTSLYTCGPTVTPGSPASSGLATKREVGDFCYEEGEQPVEEYP